ncbi:hypothetical protein OURE66S_01283 [Oligella ureolytica]
MLKRIADYLAGTELLIHNAAFDVGFLNAEFARCKMPQIKDIVAKVTDTLALAQLKIPGSVITWMRCAIVCKSLMSIVYCMVLCWMQSSLLMSG